ncbi:MAG: phosphorylase family protein [Chromatiales bacterium]
MISVGVVAALPAEASSLLGRRVQPRVITRFDDHLLIASGIGPACARAAAGQLVDAGMRALLSWGTAGALTAELGSGALLLPTQVLREDGTAYRIDVRWHERIRGLLQEKLPVHTGALALSHTVLSSAADKRALHDRTGAAAADMESTAVAEVAHQAGLPALVIRAIADKQSLTIPSFVLHATDPYGRVHLPALTRGLLRQPFALGRLIALAHAWRAALRALRTAANAIRPALSPTT